MLIPGYEVGREIGRGSMGAVYLARRAGLERTFALKVMNRAALADREAVLRFQQEARLASRIAHPGVVPVIDAGEVDGAPFYVMEHCAGETLREVLRRGPLSAPEAARLVRELADAASAAHRAGCIHRDLKPANVIVEKATGRPRITDFGLARDARASERLTRTGEVIGTPLYMAPEQVRGEKDVDARIDVYALGVILYECLSGARPYEGGSSAAIATSILHGRAIPLRVVAASVPAALARIVERAMAADRAARFESAAALRDALDAAFAEDERTTLALSSFAIKLLVLTLAVIALTTALVVAFVVHERRSIEAARRIEAARAAELRARLAANEKAARERASRLAAEEQRAAEEARQRACPDLNGRWKGFYPGNGAEIIAIVHEGDRVTATKVTGDSHVPAGEVTWRATLDGKTGAGEAQVAGEGHTNAQFIRGRLTVADANTLEFEWTDLHSSVVFTREDR